MIRIITSFICIVFFLNGCLSEEQKQTIKENRVELGDVKINYYSDKSLTSLEIPPDLTSPSYENSFRLSEFVRNVNPNVVNLTNNDLDKEPKKILVAPTDILVKKSGNRRWLIVDKAPDLVWDLSKQFLKEKGFVIKKSNRKIGIMETDFLENKPKVPAKSMGLIRSFFESQIDNVSYTLPVVDSYKVLLEPIDSGTKTQVNLSIFSMAEVISGSGKNETTFWQASEKNFALETEMLYSLMVYLGGESASARKKLLEAREEGKVSVELKDGFNGYAKLVFKLNLLDTWDNMSWAITESNLELEDKDLKERAFYIKTARTDDKGIMSKLFGEDAIFKTYQIQLKSINDSITEVYFNDVAELNEKETKDFSYEFLGKIQKLF